MRRQEHVGRFQIAVHDPLLVQSLQGVEHLQHNRENVGHR